MVDAQMMQQLMQAQVQANKPLVEFKAGRCDYDGRMVKADRRKGQIRVVNEPSMGIKKFEWYEADTQNPVDSLTIFPGDCKFEKVKQSNDRVFLLEMKQTEQRFFYWIQEADQEKDEERAKQVHDQLNGITA